LCNTKDTTTAAATSKGGDDEIGRCAFA